MSEARGAVSGFVMSLAVYLRVYLCCEHCKNRFLFPCVLLKGYAGICKNNGVTDFECIPQKHVSRRPVVMTGSSNISNHM